MYKTHTGNSKYDFTITRSKYVKLLGTRLASAFYNQIEFYSKITKRDDGYFYKTDKEFAKKMDCSVKTIYRLRKQLLSIGVISNKKKRVNGHPTMFYKPNDHICMKLLKDKFGEDFFIEEIEDEIEKDSEYVGLDDFDYGPVRKEEIDDIASNLLLKEEIRALKKEVIDLKSQMSELKSTIYSSIQKKKGMSDSHLDILSDSHLDILSECITENTTENKYICANENFRLDKTPLNQVFGSRVDRILTDHPKPDKKKKVKSKKTQINKNKLEENATKFYLFYPRHKGKKQFFKAFEKLNPSDELFETMMEAIGNQISERERLFELRSEGMKIFIPEMPYPATWIINERWLDEVKL